MADPGERWGLRLRVFLFFALIAAGAVAALAAAGVVAARHAPPEAVADLVLAFGVAAFPILLLTTWVWLKFDENVVRPIGVLSTEIRAAVHAGARGAPDAKVGRYLGVLAPAAREAVAAIAAQRARTDAAVAAAVSDAARQRGRLESVLRDLEEGLVICTLQHRIRLYNRQALQLMQVAGDLGIDRSLLALVAAQPIRHALGRLLNRFEAGRHHDHPEGLTALVVTHTLERNRQLRCRMVLTLDGDGKAPTGYILTVADITNELSAGVWRDRLLQEVTEDIRSRVAALVLAGEVLAARLPPGTPDADRFAALFPTEAGALATRLDQLDAAANDLLAGAWPMTHVLSPTLLALVRDRRSEQRDLAVTLDGLSLWLRCDSASVVDLLDRMLNRIAVFARTERFTLATRRGEHHAHVDLAWTGDPVPLDVLAVWLDERLDDGLGPITGRDVLSRHKTDLWCLAAPEGSAVLRLPLALAPAHDDRAARLPERPLVYDFDLSAPEGSPRRADTPLKALTIVVFDTETTGLEPSGGDEIVQIAGVRIVNGRVVRGEVFDSYVDPKRSIPPASTWVHGITDDRVRGADPIDRVLPRFHAFTGEAVLCAHNAAFDMSFLNRHAARLGLAFEPPVLDTVLLAAALFGPTESLTLDALATRFDITIPDEERHTAIGDSRATALVLLALFDLLEASGVVTLADAVRVSEAQVAIRRAQKAYT
ncbi:3'-5' exonuclease [Mongoliimonas terrestris]|uniref:3'-5' exonuclease n=1 Tax=Mongoliimonas terrestris TaxID=1709001 RepID=UPI0009496B02|nr:3'-5' exonuclease [Mongoliimonas terrestris]